MKRISLFLIAMFLFAGSGLKAQTPAGATSVLNYSGLENKLKKSDADIQDAKKEHQGKNLDQPCTSLVNDIYNVHNDILTQGYGSSRVQNYS